MINKLYILFLLFFLLAGCRSPYAIQEGFDFATGEYVTAKYICNDKSGELEGQAIWIKRAPGWSKYYQKYKLSYSEPILIYCGGTFYDSSGGHAECWDGFSSYDMFCRIISEYSPPVEDVQKMFRHCIKLYKAKVDYKIVAAYLTERKQFCSDPVNIEWLRKTMAFPDKYKGELRGCGWEKFDCLKRWRASFPEKLPPAFLDICINSDACDFLLSEYIKNPERANVVRLGKVMTLYDMPDEEFIETVFVALDKAGTLDEFLKVVLPPDLPSLPPPVAGNEKWMNEYGPTDYKDIPHRESALRFVVNIPQIRDHLARLYPSPQN